MAKLTSKALIAMAGTAAMKARDYARQNPHKVEQALGKVEGTVSRRTGGKYDTHLGKGTGAVRKGLGLPDAAGSSGHGVPDTQGSAAMPTSPAPPPPSWAAGAEGSAPAAERDGQGQDGRVPREGS